MKFVNRINRLEQRQRVTATCRVCNGKGRWVAEYENERFAPPKPPDNALGCRGCGKRNVITVAYVEMAIRQISDPHRFSRSLELVPPHRPCGE